MIVMVEVLVQDLGAPEATGLNISPEVLKVHPITIRTDTITMTTGIEVEAGLETVVGAIPTGPLLRDPCLVGRELKITMNEMHIVKKILIEETIAVDREVGLIVLVTVVILAVKGLGVTGQDHQVVTADEG